MKLLITLFFILSIFASNALAQGTGNSQTGTNNTFKITRPNTGFGVDISNGTKATGNIGLILKNVIILFFTVGGLGFTIMIFWGAVDWILSGGDKEKIAGARKRITTAITGLVVLSLSFLIMVIAGQVLSIDALQFGDFKIPGLASP